MPEVPGNVILENAKMVFRNFAGRETTFNSEGDRNFCIILPEDLAEALARDGWNIKTLKSREPGETGEPYIQVSVGYKYKPPTIVMITSKGRTQLGEDDLWALDWVDLQTVDLIIRPYPWFVGGRGGIKAYVQSLFVTIQEDYLMLKYADVPEVHQLPSRSGRIIEDDIIDAEVIEQRELEGPK